MVQYETPLVLDLAERIIAMEELQAMTVKFVLNRCGGPHSGLRWHDALDQIEDPHEADEFRAGLARVDDHKRRILDLLALQDARNDQLRASIERYRAHLAGVKSSESSG